MPFKPRAYNKANDESVGLVSAVSADTAKPLSDGGFNAQNVGCVDVAPLSPEQNAQMNRTAQQVEIKTTQAVVQNHVDTYGLTPPTPVTEDVEESVARFVAALIWKAVVDNGLYYFFTVPTDEERTGKVSPMTPQQRLQACCNTASRHDYRTLLEVMRMPDKADTSYRAGRETKYDLRKLEKIAQLSVLSMYDIGFLLDNSGSMQLVDAVERGLEGEELAISRLDSQKALVKIGSFVARLFDKNGVEVRTMTPDPKLAGVKMSNITTKEEIDNIFAHGVQAEFMTPTGAALRRFFDEIIKPKLLAGTMYKPYQILLITDGAPDDDVVGALRYIIETCKQTPYGSKAVMITASIVGEDTNADTTVTKWDKDSVAGPNTDCISSYRNECKQIVLSEGDTYEPGDHNIRMFIGAINPDLDVLDEGGLATRVATMRL